MIKIFLCRHMSHLQACNLSCEGRDNISNEMNLHHLANIKCAIHLLQKSVLFTQCDTGAQKYTQRLKHQSTCKKMHK